MLSCLVLDVQSRYGKFTCELAARHFYEVCDALEYLHTQTPQIIHRRNHERSKKLQKKKHEEWNRVCPPWTTLNDSLAIYVLAAGTSSPKTFCWTKISTLNLLTLDGRTSWRMSPTGWSLLCFPHLFLSFLVAVAWVKLRQIAQFLGKAINPFRPLSINDINACPSHVWIVWGPVL